MIVHCAHDAMVSVKELKPNPLNRNSHPKDQVERLAKILEYQGWRYPIKVSKRSGLITSGHGRLEAAKLLKLKEVPVSFQDYTDEAQEYADLTADNAIASWSELDLSGINSDIVDLGPDFDLDLLGIKDFILEPVEKLEPQCDEDEVPDALPEPKVVKGEVYILGKHRLMCGDSTAITDVERLMDGALADIIHTDPPYNVDYSNTDRPKPGKTDFGKIKNDSMPIIEFSSFLRDIGATILAASADNAAIYVWYASKMSVPFFEMFDDTGIEVAQQIIWKKPMLLGRGRYQWAHEPCLFAVKGSPYHTEDRTKTTVWDFGGYDKSKNVHPTQKPVFLPEEAISNSSRPGAKVLDLFGGSGSTLIACEKTDRQCFMMELDPHYCGVILDRWQKFTGKKAHREDGVAWDEIKAGVSDGQTA